jgi:hypothetical protein
MSVKEVTCLIVHVGDSVYGPGTHASALVDFSKNPHEEMVFDLLDKKGGSGKISIKMGGDDKLVLSLDLKNFDIEKPGVTSST